KEFILGFVDNGTATFDINFDGCDDGQQEVEAALQDDDPSTITITLSDTTEIEFDAYVQSFNLTGSVGAAVTGTITVRVTGDVTFSLPSSCSLSVANSHETLAARLRALPEEISGRRGGPLRQALRAIANDLRDEVNSEAPAGKTGRLKRGAV